MKTLRELYNNFTTKISPFYNDINIDVKRGVRQGDTISPKIFTTTLQNVIRTLEWDNMEVKIDGRQKHHLRFADDIALITPDISQAERMLADFDKGCGKISLRLNLKKTMFMKNGLVSFAPFTLNGTNISECSSHVYLGSYMRLTIDFDAKEKAGVVNCDGENDWEWNDQKKAVELQLPNCELTCMTGDPLMQNDCRDTHSAAMSQVGAVRSWNVPCEQQTRIC
uniref:Reverse transcriptase domain-containing protein n=1 Tax=Angiostrongylus cantonensis TaxID=6313 RepID=A0A0K0CWT4_ANGCA